MAFNSSRFHANHRAENDSGMQNGLTNGDVKAAGLVNYYKVKDADGDNARVKTEIIDDTDIVFNDNDDSRKIPQTRIYVQSYNNNGPNFTKTVPEDVDETGVSSTSAKPSNNNSITDTVPRPLGKDVLSEDSIYDIPSKKRKQDQAKQTPDSKRTKNDAMGGAKKTNNGGDDSDDFDDTLKKMALKHIVESNNKMVQFVSKYIALSKTQASVSDFFMITQHKMTTWRRIDDYSEFMDVLSQEVPDLHDDIMLHLTESLVDTYKSTLESEFGDLSLNYGASPIKDLRTLYEKLSMTGKMDDRMLRLLTMRNPSLGLKFKAINDDFFSAVNVMDDGKYKRAINDILNRKKAIIYQVSEYVKKAMNDYKFTASADLSAVFRPEFQGEVQNTLNYLYISLGLEFSLSEIIESDVVSTLFLALMIAFDKSFTNSVVTRTDDPYNFKGGRSQNGENVADRMQSGTYSGKDSSFSQLGRSRSTTYNIIGSKTKEVRSIENSELHAILGRFQNNVKRNPVTGKLEYDRDGNNYGRGHFSYDMMSGTNMEREKHRDFRHVHGMIDGIVEHIERLLAMSGGFFCDGIDDPVTPSNPFELSARPQSGVKQANFDRAMGAGYGSLTDDNQRFFVSKTDKKSEGSKVVCFKY